MPPVLAAPVPPGAAREYSSESHTDSARGVAPKYAVAGQAMTQNRYSSDGRVNPNPRWVAIIIGRR